MNLPARYHAYLRRETEALTPGNRWAVARGYALPWMVPLLVGAVLSYALPLDERGRLLVLLPLGAVSLAGVIYVGWVLLYYGVRADLRRMRAARENGRADPAG